MIDLIISKKLTSGPVAQEFALSGFFHHGQSTPRTQFDQGLVGLHTQVAAGNKHTNQKPSGNKDRLMNYVSLIKLIINWKESRSLSLTTLPINIRTKRRNAFAFTYVFIPQSIHAVNGRVISIHRTYCV